MDLTSCIRALRRRWLLLVVSVVVMTGLAGLAAAVATPAYTSTTTLFVSASDDGGGSSGAYQGGLFTQQRVKSYAKVAVSPGVTDVVAKRLGVSPAKLAEKVHIEAPLDTVLINVRATDPSPRMARVIAATMADQLTRLIPRLETPEGAAASPVRISITSPASLPLEPSSPRLKIDLALGLLAGIVIGGVLVILRETLDTTVKNEDDLQKLTGSAPLGNIADDDQVAQRPLVVQLDAGSPRAESYRMLRTNLQFAGGQHALRHLVLTSATLGEGKSITSCNLAITMAEAGMRTVLIEADLRRPRVNHFMGIESATGLTSVLAGHVPLADALQPWGAHGLLVLPSGPLPPNPSEILGSPQMVQILEQLANESDIVILDTPSLLPVTDAAVLARITDGVVLVVQARHTKRKQVIRCIESLRAVDSRLLGTVINRAPRRGVDAEGYEDEHGRVDSSKTRARRRFSGRTRR